MSESYPRRDQARGIWKINDITKNIKDDGTYPSGATRGLVAGGGTPTVQFTIDFITIENAGNAADFGDLSVARTYGAIGQAGSFTRAIFAGGVTPTYRSTIDYINFSTTGNAAFFGDSTTDAGYMAANSNDVRAVFGPRRTNGSADKTIDFITIATFF